MWFTKPSILLIDDDPSISIIAEKKLSAQNNYKVTVSDNGFDGIDIASDIKPNLIILDWIMPGLSGLDILKQIKNNSDLCNIPVLMLTGKNLIGEIEEAFSAGASGYLTKPLDLNKLIKKVNELIMDANL